MPNCFENVQLRLKSIAFAILYVNSSLLTTLSIHRENQTLPQNQSECTSLHLRLHFRLTLGFRNGIIDLVWPSRTRQAVARVLSWNRLCAQKYIAEHSRRLTGVEEIPFN